MHKTPVGFCSFITPKLCSTKKISKPVSRIFKLIYSQTENFHQNSKFLSRYNKLWVLYYSDPINDSSNKINKKKYAKSITAYDVLTIYNKIPHNKLIDKLSSISDFAFKGGCQS